MYKFTDIEIIDGIIYSLIYIIAAFILFTLGKFIYQFFHRKYRIAHELVEKDNFAFSLAITGYYVGLLLAIGGAIIGPTRGLKMDLIDIGIYGGISLLLLNISVIINDKLILYKFRVHKEIIEDQNAGTGIVEGATSVATGLILFGAVSGEGGGIDTAVVFWALGQMILVVTALVYNMILPYNIHDEIEKDNVAAGIGFAGAIIAIANIIRFGVSGPFFSYYDHTLWILIDSGIGLLLLPLVRLLADKILLPGQNLTDEIVNQEKPNCGAATIEAFAYIGGSILITWCL